MAILGTGIDMVDVARFERTITRTPRLLERLFAPAERSLKPRSLAARYAAKEALIKTLGGSDGVSWIDIEIASDTQGKPRFVLSGTTADAVTRKGITALHLTMTHDAGLAMATVLAEGPDPGQIRDADRGCTCGGCRCGATGPAEERVFGLPGASGLPDAAGLPGAPAEQADPAGTDRQ